MLQHYTNSTRSGSGQPESSKLTSRRRCGTRSAVFALIAAAWVAMPALAVNVSVMDTGINASSPPLPGRIMPGGYDFVDGDANPHDSGNPSHGTIVSAVLIYTADAYSGGSVNIVPFRMFDSDTGKGPVASVQMQNTLVGADSRVVNMSYSFPSGFDAGFARIIQDMVRSGKVVVMSAGNSSEANPVWPARMVNELGGGAIAVGAIDPATGQIASYSNRAGSAMNYYIVADGSWFGVQGTSFAAPRVSAAAALVIAAAPHLTPQQVVDILLKTATDMGVPGVDAVYGYGMLNIDAALSPQGDISVPDDDGGGGGGAGLAVAALGAAAAFAISQKNKKVEETVVVDQYNRPYVVDLNDWIEVNEYVPSLARIFENLGNEFGFIQADLGTSGTLSVQYLRPRDWDVSPLAFVNPDAVAGEGVDVAMDLRGGDAHGLHYALRTNSDPVGAVGALGFVDRAGASFLSGAALSMPFLGFADRADTATVGLRFDDQVGVAAVVTDTRDSGPFGLTSRAGMLEGSYRASERATIKVQLGQLIEDGGFFGGSPGSMLGVDEARTTAAGVSGQFRFDPRWTLVGQYAYGLTEVDEAQLSMLDEFSELRSDAWGVGLVGTELLQRGDSFGVAVSRPLRIIGGAADLTVPTAMDAAGQVFFETDRVSLAPAGSEVDLELFYRRPLSRNAEIGAYLLHRSEPSHAADRDSQTTAFGVVRARF